MGVEPVLAVSAGTDRATALALLESRDLLGAGRRGDEVREAAVGTAAVVVDEADADADPEVVVVAYGATETYAERVDALLVAAGQIGSGTATTVVLRPFRSPTGEADDHGPFGHTTGFDDLKMVAVARIVAGDRPGTHVRIHGADPELAQVALRFGADQIERPAAGPGHDAPFAHALAAAGRVDRTPA